MSESFASRLRQETRPNHIQAERSGIMRRLLGKSLDLDTYVALLRNLLPVYAALETELNRHQADPLVAPFVHPGLIRVPSLTADLAALGGPAWRELPVRQEAVSYADRIHSAAGEDPALLVAHSYVRYLGDLSGGQILKRLVAESYELEGETGTGFYEFPAIPDLDGFKKHYRAALDGLGLAPAREDRMVHEAITAFDANSRLFAALEPESELAG
jgi:heme oxygenase (biliverdin-producing, ferredoxin)